MRPAGHFPLMRHPLFRAIGLSILVVMAAAIAAGSSAAAETPPGPRLAYRLFLGDPDVFFTIGLEGGEPRPLVDSAAAALPGPSYDPGLTWSPDGTRFAYTGVTGSGLGTKPRERRIYIVPTAGGPAVEVPDSVGAEVPIFAPDGNSLAVSRSRLLPRSGPGRGHTGRKEQSSIWLLGLDGTGPLQLTPWRRAHTEVPWSFKPDGRALGIVRGVSVGPPGRHQGYSEAVALRLDGGGETRIAKGVTGLAFAPDGTRVAMLRPGKTGLDLWVGAADGADPRLISDGPRSEASPTWDPSSRRLAFTMDPAPTFHPNFGIYGNALLEVNPDGTCQKVLRTETISDGIFSPSWQPGPGRGAGPITC
jgi:dipeptidyl aminopeptidase/acylaminoacyl peptidase